MRLLGAGLLLAVAVVISGCAAPFPGSGVDPVGRGPSNPTAFLEHVRTTWTGDIPDDEVLFEYGESVCQQLVAGEEPHDVDVVEDPADQATADANTRSVVEAAQLSLCPTAVS